jgi:hypothetical protein
MPLLECLILRVQPCGSTKPVIATFFRSTMFVQLKQFKLLDDNNSKTSWHTEEYKTLCNFVIRHQETLQVLELPLSWSIASSAIYAPSEQWQPMASLRKMSAHQSLLIAFSRRILLPIRELSLRGTMFRANQVHEDRPVRLFLPPVPGVDSLRLDVGNNGVCDWRGIVSVYPLLTSLHVMIPPSVSKHKV